MKSESASTALGTVATVCWCIQLIPQIWYNWKRKDCTGLPPIMMFLWVISGIPFAIYFCVSAPNIILQVQPHLFMFFCGISFIQTMYYPPASMNRIKIVIFSAAILLADIGMEIGFIIWLKPLYTKGETWPDLIFGIIASVLLAIGLLPPYFELAKRKGRVVGINFLFLLIDSMGAWLSIASVCVGTMDTMGIILYAIIAAMELGLFISHGIWYLRVRISNKELIDSENEEDEMKEKDEMREKYELEDKNEIAPGEVEKAEDEAESNEEEHINKKQNFNTKVRTLEDLGECAKDDLSSHEDYSLIHVSNNTGVQG